MEILQGYAYHIKDSYFKVANLIQNMFPMTKEYIDHIHTKNENPIPVKKELQKVIEKNVKSFRALSAKGVKVTFTDIIRLEKLMMESMTNE